MGISVKVKLFGPFYEMCGRKREIVLNLPDKANVDALLSAMLDRYPDLRNLLGDSKQRKFTLVMVNNKRSEPDQAVADGDEVCLFSAVMGGCSKQVSC